MHKENIEELRKLFIGIDTKVKVNERNKMVPINFDNAATTPVFKRVMKKILESSEYYGSIARGDGQKSQYCSDVFENCRRYLLNFFNAPEDIYTAIFINNTTDGINKLANTLITDESDIVVTTRMEHHSNDLPWRGKCNLKYIEVDELGRLKLDDLEGILIQNPGRVKYVTISGASNVTGYINDIRKIAKISHKYGAKIIVDAAQLVAHKKVSMLGSKNEDNIDFLVFSAHKMYAPFGSGAIIGLKEAFNKSLPHFSGGGTVEIVRDYNQIWLGTPERNEAGTPNYFGVVAMIEAFKGIEKIGYKTIEDNEKELLDFMVNGMKALNRVVLYGDVENMSDRLGIVVFNIKGINYEEVGEKLANIRAIAVRQGGFCAHPYVRRILGIKDCDLEQYILQNGIPGMIRSSLGIYNSKKEVDIFLDTIESICKRYGKK